MEGVIDVADRNTDEFDALRACVVDLTLMLYTTLPQQQAEPPPEWLLIKNILAEYGLSAICFVAEWKAAQQQAEPTCPECKAKVLFECVACSSNNYPPQQQAEPVQKLVAWGVFDNNLHDMFFTEEEAQEMVRLKGDGSTVAPLYTAPPAAQPEQKPMHPELRKMWEDYFDKCVCAQPEQVDCPRCGHVCSQREWQGLTTEEVKHLYPYGRSVWGKETFEAIEKALKEKNNAN